MSYLFVGTVLSHRIFLYAYDKFNQYYSDDTNNQYLNNVRITKELFTCKLDSSNITFQNMNINKYYEKGKYIGCQDDYSDNTVPTNK